MRGFEGFGNMLGTGQCLVEPDWALLDAIRQGRPFNKFQHQRTDTLCFFQSVDVADVRIVQLGENLRFTLEPGQAVWVGCEGIREHFQRDLAVQPRIGRAIDLAHAALADEGGHVIVVEPETDVEGHEALGSSLSGDVLLLVVRRGQGGTDDLAVVTMHDVPVSIRRV